MLAAPAPTIGQKIRQARGDRSRASVAREVGVDYSTFWRWEVDEAEPSGPSLARLRAVLGIDLLDEVTR